MEQTYFAIMPIEALADKRLTLEQLRVLGALFSFRGKDTNTVWPSRQAIADRIGMNVCNISTATSALERMGWLRKEGKGGYGKATRYTISVPDTVAQSATVAERATVAQQATTTVAQQATPTVAYQATRKEHNQEHNQKNITNTGADESRFAAFWSVYPKKEAKLDAKKAWAKLNPDAALLETILSAIEQRKKSDTWQRGFIPNPATWINGRRWEDEIDSGRTTYADDERDVFEIYNETLAGAGWPEAVLSPYSDERAAAIRKFLQFGEKPGWIQNYFSYLRDNLEAREGYGLDWVLQNKTYLRAREGNFSALREAA